MGATHVTVRITNPVEPGKFWEGLFLVDTGAADSLAPRPQLEAIGLKPEGKRLYELADGSEITGNVAVAGCNGAGIRRYRSGPRESAVEETACRAAQGSGGVMVATPCAYGAIRGGVQ